MAIVYPSRPQGVDFSGFERGLASLADGLEERRDRNKWRALAERELGQFDGGQQEMSLASLAPQQTRAAQQPAALATGDDIASQRVAQAHAASGGNPAPGAIEAYIRHAAQKRGIDPEIAVKVAMSEGGVTDPTRQSDVVKDGVREQSYGPFQLYMNGGLGNEALAAGIDPRQDWKGGIDFALDKAKEGGWGPWYGAAKVGITGMDGIGGPQIAMTGGEAPSGVQMAQSAPAGNSGGFPFSREFMVELFADPRTRQYGIQIAREAQRARMGDPEAALRLEKLRLEVDQMRDPEQEAPKIVELFDEGTGQPYKATFNAQTGQYERIGGIKAPSGMQVEMGPDGQFTLTQGPMKDKPLNVDQAKNAGFLVRGRDAHATISELEEQGTSMKNKVLRNLPGGVGNYGLTPESQKFEQAKRDFVNAVLRRESGAVISDEEFANADQQYFPQPGDGPEVIAQKRRNRENAIKGFAIGAGPAGTEPEKRRYRFNIETGELE